MSYYVWIERMRAGNLPTKIKHALLGLASLERTIDKQRSRIRWIREGDANTKLFQAVANGRRSKNFIPHVRHGNEIVTNQDRKGKSSRLLMRICLGMHRLGRSI